MALYEMTSERFESLTPTTFEDEGITERADLQRILADQIQVIDSELLVLCDEFNHWEGTKRRIDLLCMDREARLVVIELKRNQSGNHMELQALRYAAMISTMTFKEAVESYARYKDIGRDEADQFLVEHVHDENIEEVFGSDVRIILASANFSQELVATVTWLNKRDLDIRCIRLRPFKLGSRLIVQAEQVIPLVDAGDFEFRVRTKETERRASFPKTNWTGAWFLNVGEDKSPCRSWEDSAKYQYISAGGGKSWQDQIRKPAKGELVFAYINSVGYVGVGTVLETAVPCKGFVPHNQTEKLVDLSLAKPLTAPSQIENLDTCEYCLSIHWHALRDRTNPVREDHRRGTARKIHDEGLVSRLCNEFKVGRYPEINP